MAKERKPTALQLRVLRCFLWSDGRPGWASSLTNGDVAGLAGFDTDYAADYLPQVLTGCARHGWLRYCMAGRVRRWSRGEAWDTLKHHLDFKGRRWWH